jgi:antitoxin ParD1/3/4
MHIALPKDVEELIARKEAAGESETPGDLLIHAVYLLDAHDRVRQQQLEELRREIAIGIEQCDRGEVVDADEVFAELERKAARLKSPAE